LLLKLGAAMMAIALAVAGGVALVVSLSGHGTMKPAPVAKITAAAPIERTHSYKASAEGDPAEPVAAAPTTREKQSGEPAVVPQGPTIEEGEPERLGGEPASAPERRQRRAQSAPQEDPPQSVALPVMNAGWPSPSPEELQAVERPRRFTPDPNAPLTLTVSRLGVYDAPVYDSDSEQALANGVVHVPETSMPWDRDAQRNVYLASHRIGYPGTGSRLLFYNLNELGRGDEVVLKGRGKTYRYRVTEVLVVGPNDSWVMGQVRGRDMVSLQTCTPIPTFDKRLIVRANRV
jgi:sortase A